MAKWLKRNASNLILFAAGIALLAWFYRGAASVTEALTSTWPLLLMFVGLGFVIFIHELGHFLAAKLCGVRVDTFSVGFGKAIPGCHFKRGETHYKLAVFPLGGYVRMLGQEDPGTSEGDQDAKAAEIDPRSFKNKTVGQRMLIISAGVIMNVILGMLCFVYVYLTGKEEQAPLLGQVEPGSPAALAGIQAGSELVEINKNAKPTYEDLFFATALGNPGETTIFLKWRTPAGELREANVVPRKLKTDIKPLIGVVGAKSLELAHMPKQADVPAMNGTPAERADFRSGDKLQGVRSLDLKEFREFKTGWDLVRAEYDFRAEPVFFEVLRKGALEKIRVEPQYFETTPGLRMKMGPIKSITNAAPTEVREQLHPGDTIVAVGDNRSFDPMRLPDLIMDKAGSKVELTVRRQDAAPGGRETKVVLTPPKGRGTWNEERPISRSSPVSIPALGIAYGVFTTIEGVDKDSEAAKAGLQPGDVVQSVMLTSHQGKNTSVKLESTQWPWLFWSMQGSAATIEFRVKRPGSETETSVTLAVQPDKTWPLPERGFILEPETKTVVADDIGMAISLGFRDTYRWIVRIYLSLKGLITAKLSVETLSGPIGMLELTYQVAEQGINKLILFLGILSINLAVINFLPIPVLDGGHMAFLIVEKIRGKPASERAQAIANTIGLAIVASLMLFVIYLDISKRL